MKPIVSNIISPNAKCLTRHFKSLESEETYERKNSAYSIGRTPDSKVLPHEISGSFDIKRLFPCAPMQADVENIDKIKKID
jgi:hypothetical protein